MFPVTLTINTAQELNLVLAALGHTPAAVEIRAVNPEPAPAPKVEKNKAQPKVELTKTQTDAMDDTAGLEAKGNAAPAASTQPTAEAPKADAPAPKAISYADLQAAVLKLHKADSSAAKPIAEAMGFANFKAVPEDKWPEALAAVQAALSERGVV